jgi:hypothetical protein
MWLYLIPVLLALVVLLCRVPSHVGTLAPRSGRSWKAYLAYGLIKAGARKKLKENKVRGASKFNSKVNNPKIISPKDHEKMVPNPECDKNWNNSFVFTATNPNEDGDPQLLYSRLGFRGDGLPLLTDLTRHRKSRSDFDFGHPKRNTRYSM